MSDKNKKKLKVKWYDALNPLKMVGGAVNVYKQEIKKKRNNENKSTKNTINTPNPKQDEIKKVNKSIKNAKGWNKEQLEKKKKHLEKFGKSKTWSNPYGAKGEGKPSTVDTSKTKKKSKWIKTGKGTLAKRGSVSARRAENKEAAKNRAKEMAKKRIAAKKNKLKV